MKRVLLGVGNRLSHDDAVGPMVAEGLTGAPGWISVDCGTALENACGLVARESPDLLVVVDAALMGLTPGAIRRIPLRARDRMLASTHGLPIAFVWERFASTVGRTVLLGIEPADLSFGEGLSPAVAAAVERLGVQLRAADIDSIPEHDADGPNKAKTP